LGSGRPAVERAEGTERRARPEDGYAIGAAQEQAAPSGPPPEVRAAAPRTRGAATIAL